MSAATTASAAVSKREAPDLGNVVGADDQLKKAQKGIGRLALLKRAIPERRRGAARLYSWLISR
ncbi:MAG: hypothetical protein ACC700_21165 [Anaerolineales bacterium]